MKIRSFSLVQAAFLLLVIFMGYACKNSHAGSTIEDGKDTITYPRIQHFLLDQAHSLGTGGATLTYVESHNGKDDSSILSSPALVSMLTDFLASRPQDSGWLPDDYRRTLFSDSVHHTKIVSFEAISDTLALNRMDVSLDSASGVIRQIYIQHIDASPDSTIRKQLIWKEGQYISMITMIDKQTFTTGIRKQKIVWGQPQH